MKSLNTFRLKAIFSFIFITFFIAVGFSQATTLSLNLEQGKEYKQVYKSTMQLIQNIQGQEFQIDMAIAGGMGYTVKEVVEDAYNLDVSYDKLLMSMKLPQGTIEFSSEKNDPSDIMSTALSHMKDIAFHLQLTKTGKVKKIENVDKLWEVVINNLEKLSETEKEQIRQQLMNNYGAEALKSTIELTTAIYPDKPVKKEDQWTIETQLNSGFVVDIITEYTLVEVTQDQVMIKGNSIMKPSQKNQYVQNMQMQMKYEVEGVMTSDITIDKNSGWIIEAKTVQNLEGDLLMKPNSESTNEIKIPIKIFSESITNNQ